jgi:hypothetical protein
MTVPIASFVSHGDCRRATAPTVVFRPTFEVAVGANATVAYTRIDAVRFAVSTAVECFLLGRILHSLGVVE